MKLTTDNIANIAPYIPGKPISELERELGADWPPEVKAAGAIKLASNENPLGPSPKAVEAMRAVAGEQHLYPDGAAFFLRRGIAQHIGVPDEQIIVGAGSNELINILVQTFVGPDEEVLAPRYSFICYRLAAEIMGRRFVEAPVHEDFSYDVSAILERITPRTKVLFLANPNNPTGAYLPKAEFEALLDRVPPETIIAVDEAYFEYAAAADYPSAIASRARRERLISLRTFSKVYGLAGLRVGFAVGPSELVGYMNRVRMPFNTGALAQSAALAALGDRAHLDRALAENRRGLERVTRSLSGMGLAVSPSHGNFVLVDMRPHAADKVYQALLRRGVIVRPVANYGLGHHLRITIGTDAQCARLEQSLREVLG